MRKRKYTKEVLAPLVAQSKTVAEISTALGLKLDCGGNHVLISKRIKEYGLDTSHFIGRSHRGMSIPKKSIPLCEILVKGSTYSRGSLKKRLLKEGLLEKKCYVCPQGPIWNGRPLVFHLDHISGDGTDNRLENLRLLCPNCHSQTSTYAGRKNKRHRRCQCGRPMKTSKAGKCKRCAGLERPRKAERPGMDILRSQIEQLGFSAVGRKYGVSDNAIRKWLRVESVV